MSTNIQIAVEDEGAGQRLDHYLAVRPELVAESLSRTRVKSLIEAGLVWVDGGAGAGAENKIARRADGRDRRAGGRARRTARRKKFRSTFVFEDEFLVVLDKPAGLVVHPGAGHETGTLVNALIAHCGESLSGVGGVKRPGIVHRLDKDTSGLLVVAKTDAAHQGLSRLFADHGRSLPLTREYLAICWGAPERLSGTIDAPLGRHSIQREKMAIVPESRGREAITHWRLLEKFGADREGKPVASLVACELETGRTHQIRVHLGSIGHPLLGDEVYGAGFRTKARLLSFKAQQALAALGRQALHARALGFEHPVTGEELHFESEPPEDFHNLLDALRAG